MPDHFHARIEGLQPSSHLPTFVRRFKQCSSYEWKRKYSEALWQRGFYDHVLREDEDMHAIAAYILANRVRAGLCDDAVSYPFSGSESMLLTELAVSAAMRPRARG